MEKEFLSTREASKFLGIAEQTLANYRNEGKPPRYHKPRGKIFYLKSDLIAWLESGASE